MSTFDYWPLPVSSLKNTFYRHQTTKCITEIVNAECYEWTTNCIQWVKRLMSIPRRWCNRPRFGLTLTLIFLCKIRAPRLLVTVRVFCLFHTASKCTKTSQIHVQHYNNWKSCSTQQGRRCCLRQAYYLTNPRVTLTFDLLTSKLIVSRRCLLTTCANLHQISSIIFKISSWQVC